MYCGHGLPPFVCTRAKQQVAVSDRARRENVHSCEDVGCQNVPDTSGITAVELKIE